MSKYRRTAAEAYQSHKHPVAAVIWSIIVLAVIIGVLIHL